MDDLKVALERAHSWFSIHAEQRIKLMNFYVILLAGTLALLGTALKDNNDLLKIIIGISILLITFIFKNLDRRTAALIKSSEFALREIEKRIASELQLEQIKLIEIANKKSNLLTYRQSFNLLYVLGCILGISSIFLVGDINHAWNQVTDSNCN